MKDVYGPNHFEALHDNIPTSAFQVTQLSRGSHERKVAPDDDQTALLSFGWPGWLDCEVGKTRRIKTTVADAMRNFQDAVCLRRF